MRAGSRQSLLVVAVAFVSLCLPWVTGAFGVRPTTVENRALERFPELTARSVADASYFSALDRYLLDHAPARRALAESWTRWQFELTGRSPTTDVFVGTDGTLFLSEDFLGACANQYDATDVTDRIASWDRVARSVGKTLVFTIAPDKASVRPDVFTMRAGLARGCGDRKRADWQAGMARPTGFLPLWATLRTAQAGRSDPLYYAFDSHWNDHGAAVFAEALVDSLLPGAWEESAVAEGPPRVVRADIARRLGWLEVETGPTLVADRAGVATESSAVDVDGTRPVREYRSTAAGAPLIEGSTVILHDSMMNFAEQLLAPYFEEVTFVHWNDIEAAEFFDLVAEADGLVIEVVERSSHVRATRFFDDADIDEAMRAALSQAVHP